MKIYNVIVVFTRDGRVHPFGHTSSDDFFLKHASQSPEEAEALARNHALLWDSTVEKCVVVQVEV